MRGQIQIAKKWLCYNFFSFFRFIKPTFFEELHVLIRPTSLAAISKKNYPGNQGIHHESTLKFALSPQQLNHIKANTIGLDDNMGDVKQVSKGLLVQSDQVFSCFVLVQMIIRDYGYHKYVTNQIIT